MRLVVCVCACMYVLPESHLALRLYLLEILKSLFPYYGIDQLFQPIDSTIDIRRDYPDRPPVVVISRVEHTRYSINGLFGTTAPSAVNAIRAGV